MNRLILFLLFFWVAFFSLSGCGGSTSDPGVPTQQQISPSAGTLSGRVHLSSQINTDNLGSKNRLYALGSVTNFSGFEIYGWYLSGLQKVILPGVIYSDGSYLIGGVPFGQEIFIVAKKGWVELRTVAEPVFANFPDRSADVDLDTTVESVLYEDLKTKSPGASISDLRQTQLFVSEKEQLVNVLKNELSNLNVDSSSPPVLERDVVVSQVSAVSNAIVNHQALNHLPYVVIEQIDASQRARVQLRFRLFDAETDPANVQVFYSVNSSSVLSACSQAQDAPISLTQMSTSRDQGVLYTYYWESSMDLGVGRLNSDVTLTVKVWPAGSTSLATNTNQAKTVSFIVDNRGLAEIVSVQPERNPHEIGTSQVVMIQGTNLNQITSVEMEHFETDPLVLPRRYPLASSAFQVLTEQSLRLNLPAYGLYPVSYRILLKGANAGETTVSIQTIRVQEIAYPDFSLLSPSLSPSQTANHTTATLQFRGYNLLGATTGKVFLKKPASTEIYRLTPLSASYIAATTEVQWVGSTPTRMPTGVYELYVCNSTIPLCNASNATKVAANNTNSVYFTVIESSPVIFSVSTQNSGGAVNSQDSKITILGERLSSVSEIRISTNRAQLVNSFSSQQLLEKTLPHSFTEVNAILPLGSRPGTYYVGIKNQGGISVSNSSFQILESAIPADQISLSFKQGGSSIVSPMNNKNGFEIHISGKSLSSLSKIRFINQDISSVVFDQAPVSAIFNLAVINFPQYSPPGRYRFDLFNNQGATPITCDGFSCFQVTENMPVITSFVNSTKSQDLTTYQVIAGENARLQIQGESLSGVTGGKLCLTPANCVYNFDSLTRGFFEIQADVGSQSYMKPGTYLLSVTNLAGTAYSPANVFLDVLERTPVIEAIQPNAFASNQLAEGSNSVRITGRNLFGVSDIYLLKSVAGSNPCTQNPLLTPWHFSGTEVLAAGAGRVDLILNNVTTLDPGTYAMVVKNRTPGGTTPFSYCDRNTHAFRVTEPVLQFLNFNNSTPVSAISTAVTNHVTNRVEFVGRYLSGLDTVLLKPRVSILNNPSQFAAKITSTLWNFAAFDVPSGLIPGTYDLHMKNSGMSVPALISASIEVTEISTPVISAIELVGSNQENTADVFFHIYGRYLEGVGLVTKDVRLIDVRDPLTHIVPMPSEAVSFLIKPDLTRYLRFKVPTGTPGGDYFVSVRNTSAKSNVLENLAKIRIYDPRAVFTSASVVGPFDHQYGFGENNKKLRIELQGNSLASSDQIQLIRLPDFSGDSQESIVLQTSVIQRQFGSQSVSVITTLDRYQRPGYYNVQVRNNSSLFSELINPITSPYFQQVYIREGAPILEFVGCRDVTGLDSACKTNHLSRDVNALQDLEFTGRNFYTLSKIRLYRDSARTPEWEYLLPAFGQSLSGTGLTTFTSRTAGVDLPQFVPYIGYYDLELTNRVSTVRFSKKLRILEKLPALILAMNPKTVENHQNRVVAVSGNHLTGTTSVAIYSQNMSIKITDCPFTKSPVNPLESLSFTVPANLMPGTYKVKITNTVGFNSTTASNLLTVTEPSPSITSISSVDFTNEQTRVLRVVGEGFLGLSEVRFKPADAGSAGSANSNMSIAHVNIPLTWNVLDHNRMDVTVSAKKLPGYYQFSLKNTQPTSYLHPSSVRIRETTPVILTISPDFANYASAGTVKIKGSSFLGIRGSVISATHAKMIHKTSLVERTLSIVGEPKYDEIELQIPVNMALGRYEFELKNQAGVASTVSVTSFWIREGLVSLSNVTPLTLAYDVDFNSSVNRLSFYGTHLQGVQKIQIRTTVLGTEYLYTIKHQLCTIDPYVSLTNCPIDASFVYPGKYLLEVTNSAGKKSFTTPVFHITKPASTITDMQPRVGPFNVPTKITFTGTHLRRFETLRFERGASVGDADDSIDILQISTNSDSEVFRELSHGSFEINFYSQLTSGVFATGSGGQNTFNLVWKTYGDSTTRKMNVSANLPSGNSHFTLQSNVPDILTMTDTSANVLPKTDDYVDRKTTDPQIYTTSVYSPSLPMNLRLVGQHYTNIQKIKLVKDSVSWTLACTSGTGSAALNAGNLTQVDVTIPREIFHFPVNTGGNACANTNSYLPLQPGVYSIVLEDTTGNSSLRDWDGKIYFSESLPNNLTVLNSGNTFYNDEDLTITVNTNNPLGVREVEIFNSAGTVSKKVSVEKARIVSDTQFTFALKAGELRGMKNDLYGPYAVKAKNSRGWGNSGPGSLIMREQPPVISSVSPKNGSIASTHPILVNGDDLLGVGQIFAPPSGKNFFKMIHKESYSKNDWTTIVVDLTNSVTVQSLSSFVAVVPKNIMPGQYFFFVENDHHVPSANPKKFMDNVLLFTALDSTPVVTSVFPLVSDFDLLPTSMTLTGSSLIGVRGGSLKLRTTATANLVPLSLVSYPDLTSAKFDSVKFSLPQSPTWLIPGIYDIFLTNTQETVHLPNFQLEIREKSPVIYSALPMNLTEFNNHDKLNFKILGDNLFGYPVVSVGRNQTTHTLSLNGVLQSRTKLEGLTLPGSLYPDLWTLSVKNSQGSTHATIEITESLPLISQICVVPWQSQCVNQVPYNGRTQIAILGDHFLGATTAAGTIILTDELKTPLENAVLVDRHTITAWVPEGVNLGWHGITLSNKKGKNTTSARFLVKGSGMMATSISPQSGLQKGGEYIVIRGSGFVQGTRVVLGNSLCMDVRVYPDKIEAFTPVMNSSLNISSGSVAVDVEIVSPDGETYAMGKVYTYLATVDTDPVVLDVFPGAITGAGPSGIHRWSKVAVIFDQPMKEETILSPLPGLTNFYGLSVVSVNGFPSSTISFNSQKNIFVWSQMNESLFSNDQLDVGLASQIRSLSNRALKTTDVIQNDSVYYAKDFTENWGFKTGTNQLADSALSVLSPSSGGSISSHQLTNGISLHFSTHVNPLTLKPEDVFLTKNSTQERVDVSLQVLKGGIFVLVDPDQALEPAKTYTLRFKNTNLESLTGRKMSSDYLLNINTEDSTARLVSHYPMSMQTGVSRNTRMVFEFDQAMDLASINSSNLEVTNSTQEKQGLTFYEEPGGKVFTIGFMEDLEPQEWYVVKVSNRIKAKTGVAISQQTTFAFQVSELWEKDLSEPVVNHIYPSNLESGVSTYATMIITFSESIHMADVTSTNFLLQEKTGETLGNLSYTIGKNSSGDTIYLTPTTNFSYSQEYFLRVNSGIRDMSGNASMNQVPVVFTTVEHFDSAGPGIESVDPHDQEQNVLISRHILVTFNEPVAPMQLTSSFIRLETQNGSSVAGGYTQEGDGRVIRFIPQDPLQKLSQYRIVISSEIEDVFGNSIGVQTITSFTTENFVDTTPPVITLLSVNGIPAPMNGSSGALTNNQGVLAVPILKVPANGFSIDIYYEDPGSGGEASGVDTSSISIRDEKQVMDTSLTKSLTGLNLLAQSGASITHNQGHTRLIVPPAWSFGNGLHVLRATVKDKAVSGNLSAEVIFEFQVAPVVSNENHYPFSAGPSTFSLEYENDSFTYLASTQLGNLRLQSSYSQDGGIDFIQELMLMGLICDDSSFAPGDPRLAQSPTPSQIRDQVISLLKGKILSQTRAFFRLNPVTGEPLDSFDPVGVRVGNELPIFSGLRRIRIGGDNGENPSGALSSLSVERSLFNTANRLGGFDLIARSAQSDQGYGVFTGQMVRRYANDPGGNLEWKARFAKFATIPYTNVGNVTGEPVGWYVQDANIYNVSSSQASTYNFGIEFHKTRYFAMQTALDSYARLVASHVARTIAIAVGAVAQGFPPDGLFGGSLYLSSYFEPSQSVFPWIRPVGENNLMRKDLDANSIFSVSDPLEFSVYSLSYLKNQAYVATIESTQVPPAPGNPELSAGNAQVVVNWNAVVGATSYNLYWSTSSNVSLLNGTKVSNVMAPYTLSGLANNVPVYVILTAQNSMGESLASPVSQALPKQPSGFAISTTAFASGAVIPTQYACDGLNVNPPLTIQSVPAGTQSLVLIVDDSSASNFSHWLLWNIPPTINQISQNSTPAGAMTGKNGFGTNDYQGPCPPSGSNYHDYHFRLYALDSSLSLPAGSTRAEILSAMQGRIVENLDNLIGKYAR